MSPSVKGTIAFAIGALAATYGVTAAIGLILCLRMVYWGMTIQGIWEAPTVSLLIAIPAAIICFRYRRSMRWIEAGKCRRCGYDLRGTPERCPECGTAAKNSD